MAQVESASGAVAPEAGRKSMIDLVGLANALKKWGLPVVIGGFLVYHFDQKLSVIEEAQPDKRLAVIETRLDYMDKKMDKMDSQLEFLVQREMMRK